MKSLFNFKTMAFVMGAMVMGLFSSCSDSDDAPEAPEQGLEVKTVMLSRKTNYGNDWIYFSLSQGKEIEVAEEKHMEDQSWDLAFNRYNIRTNSGKSGKGQGGAFDTQLVDMAAVTEVPSGISFTTDTDAEITGSFTGSGVTYVSSTLNEVLGTAIKFQGPPPSYTPNNHVYIVKTADGKYAKVKVLGFHNEKGKSGFVSFQYAYQPDGSKNIK